MTNIVIHTYAINDALSITISVVVVAVAFCAVLMAMIVKS